jgi:hypothetical protein
MATKTKTTRRGGSVLPGMSQLYRDGLAYVELTKMIPDELEGDEKFLSMLSLRKPKRRMGGMPSSWYVVKPRFSTNIGMHPMVEKALDILDDDNWTICDIYDAGDITTLKYGVVMMKHTFTEDDETHEYCRVLRSGAVRKIKV